MRYLCLVYAEEAKLAEVDDRHCVEFDEGLRQDSRCLASEALQPVANATTLRPDSHGEIEILDGPFAETKEQLAGFYIIEARDLNHAIQIAKGIPPLRVGCVEIRPIRQLPDRSQQEGEL